MSTYKHLVEMNNNLVRKVVKWSGLPPDFVRNIVCFTKCLVKPGSISIDQQIFFLVMSTYFDLMDTNIVTRIYHRLSKNNTDKQVSQEDFINMLCMFFSDDLDIKIDHVFKLYDSNADGTIDSREVASFVSACKCVTDTDDADKDETFFDLCTMASATLGIGKDGITLEDFREKVKQDQLILIILGQSLPPCNACESFRLKIAGKTSMQMKETFGQIRHELLHELPEESRTYPIMLDLP